MLRLGSCWGGFDCANPSYLAPAHFRAFRAFTLRHGGAFGVPNATLRSEADAWSALVQTSYAMLEDAQCEATGLTPNWWRPAGPHGRGSAGCNASGTAADEFGSEAARGVHGGTSKRQSTTGLHGRTRIGLVSKHRGTSDPSPARPEQSIKRTLSRIGYRGRSGVQGGLNTKESRSAAKRRRLRVPGGLSWTGKAARAVWWPAVDVRAPAFANRVALPSGSHL